MLPEWVIGIENKSLFTSGAHLSSKPFLFIFPFLKMSGKPSDYGKLWSNKYIKLFIYIW